MHTTTHPLPPEAEESLLTIAEATGATLVLNNAPHAQQGPYGEHHTQQDQTATWYADEDQQPVIAHVLAQFNLAPEWTPLDTTRDYVADTAATFPPLTIGTLFIARNNEPTPDGFVGLSIPANKAFGSGEHATTSGCLESFLSLHKQGKTFSHGLDFGCGSALLALAAAKLAGIPFLAVDNDPDATAIAAENAEANGLTSLMQGLTADTPTHRDIQTSAPYPLIFANVLLGPLLSLQQPLADALAKDGYLILSGFTEAQEPDIMNAYQSHGLTLHHRHQNGQWMVLTFTKP